DLVQRRFAPPLVWAQERPVRCPALETQLRVEAPTTGCPSEPPPRQPGAVRGRPPPPPAPTRGDDQAARQPSPASQLQDSLNPAASLVGATRRAVLRPPGLQVPHRTAN